MNLSQFLKRFKNIAWYPSAGLDGMPMACLSFASLVHLGFHKDEVPDCFLYTDYSTLGTTDSGRRFVLDVDSLANEAPLVDYEEFKVTAFNIQELPRLKLKFDQELVAFAYDSRYYGRVFIADILVEHSLIGRSVTKLVYVFAENTCFAHDVLLPYGIKITFPIHSAYGHGFGGGRSNGAYMFYILKDLGAKYFASDMGERDVDDIADRYLTEAQLAEIPVLWEMQNFASSHRWVGYDDTRLYRIVGYAENKGLDDGPRPRFIRINN